MKGLLWSGVLVFSTVLGLSLPPLNAQDFDLARRATFVACCGLVPRVSVRQAASSRLRRDNKVLAMVTPAKGEPRAPEADIREVLDAQVAAWNRGEVAGFMEGYWNSPKTTFVGSKGVLRGWNELLERYRRDYPDRRAMGTLAFSDLEVSLLSSGAALVLGRWQLERANDRPGGVFTLVFRKFPEGWRIVHDHTSALGLPKAVDGKR